MATSSFTDGKKVRFKIDEDELEDDGFSGEWDFLRYLLTMKEDLNVAIIVDNLVKRRVLDPSNREEILKQTTERARIELCLNRVRATGTNAYTQFCDALRDTGYSNVLDTVATDGEEFLSSLDGLVLPVGFPAKNKGQEASNLSGGFLQVSDDLAVRGVKMSISSLSKETRASQREFTLIIERQTELEKQLTQVLKSLDTAKEALIRERQEKIGLREQLRLKDEDLATMQRKYLELQKAIGSVKETNNKYHDKVTKLQIENEQLKKAGKDKANLETELSDKNRELEHLKMQLKHQEKQICLQEETIINKLNLIEKLVSDQRDMAEGHDKLKQQVNKQAEDIYRLSSEKNESSNQVSAQQKQLNFQQAQIVMLQEQMQRLENHLSLNNPIMEEQEQPQQQQQQHGHHPSTLGKKYLSNLTKSVHLRPFNASGKLESSKSSFWKEDSNRKNK
ncbi:hypothetical protein CHS0354_036023 [Potamilus streckersoni]|uniref:CARD domain-containing protein n=1 Tax=Potamilus streckersoni TaxID=2493646 RepID=A0AAE0RMT5_9BIVA|nr:hypothetical protein CHS0354_036023 [Potamilus streckersoni]